MKRFWSKVEIIEEDKCWIWKASTSSAGYGLFYLNGKLMNASRASWIIKHGTINNNLLVLHKCDNKLCVNPSHLYLGNHSNNMSDLYNRNPPNIDHYKRISTKVSAKEILEIRMLNTDKNSIRKAEKLVSVPRELIRKIWKSDRYMCKEGYYV